MKTVKWIILILLLLALLAGAFLSDSLIRFSLDLQERRYDEASRIYRSPAALSSRSRQEADVQLQRYVDGQYEQYIRRDVSYESIQGILILLQDTDLPQKDVMRCLDAVAAMEAARTDLKQADAYVASRDYAKAIPLFRQSLIADESAPLRLKQAESAYLDQILEEAISDMDAEQYPAAEKKLMDGLAVLGTSDDLLAALADVRRMEIDRQYAAWEEEARRLWAEQGAAASFSYVAGLRTQAPETYPLEYLEQRLYHEFEEDICARAISLRDGGSPTEACVLLEEGLKLLDSQEMRALLAQIRATIPYLLGELPLSQDHTVSGRTGAKSTVSVDSVTQDALGNTYEHSFSADSGSISFPLDGRFALFTGTVAFPMNEKTDIYRTSASLQIFGDGRLLGEFKEIESASAPIPFSIPVEGVQELTLCWISQGADGWKDWGRFATIFDGKLLAPSL